MNLSIRHNTSILYFFLSIVFLISTMSCNDKNIYKLSTEQDVSIDTLDLKEINIYLETSASMKGYVNSNVPGNYPLKDVLPFMITDLDNTFNIKSNLYTISDRQKKFMYSNAKFSELLRTGLLFTGKSSKLQNIFTNVISETTTGTVSFLISDCIPDLGNINTKTEGTKITNQIYSSIAGNESLGIAVFKYNSDFNGTHYFNRLNNNGVSYTKRPFYNKILKNRPLYIWVFGEKTIVSEVLSKHILKEYTSSHSYNLSLKSIEAGLLKHPKSGKISINTETNTMIIQEVEQRKPATFTIGTDLSAISNLEKEQLLDTLNYQVVPSFIQETISLKIKDKATLLSEKIKDKSVIQQTKYTHFIQPTLYDFDPETETISINILSKEPKWVQTTTLDDDVNITETELEYKTFGFKFISDAFNKTYHHSNEPRLQFKLTKQKNK